MDHPESLRSIVRESVTLFDVKIARATPALSLSLTCLLRDLLATALETAYNTGHMCQRETHPDHVPRRGSDVEAWLLDKRDTCNSDGIIWNELDELLKDYQAHADAGQLLTGDL